jgi:hypothetical protein
VHAELALGAVWAVDDRFRGLVLVVGEIRAPATLAGGLLAAALNAGQTFPPDRRSPQREPTPFMRPVGYRRAEGGAALWKRYVQAAVSSALYEYTSRLTGLDVDRAKAARDVIRELEIPHVNRELVDPQSIDAVVASVLLADSLDDLLGCGVPRTKLIAKLRNDREVWPTWAELRAAAVLAHFLEEGAELQLEADRSRGRHSDFRAARRVGPAFRFLPQYAPSSVSIEFKAVGLSNEEAEFCRRARPTLDAMRPRAGFVTLHAPLEMSREGVWLPRAERRHGEQEAVKMSRRYPSHAQGLSGATVVAQGAEGAYYRRAVDRFERALNQLPPDEEAWVAFHWSNGAPVAAFTDFLKTVELPRNVLGIALIGSAVAFPYPDIHNFIFFQLRRDANSEADNGGSERDDGNAMEYHSDLDADLARKVFERVDRSSGVRASVVRGETTSGLVDVLMRAGAQRILPYILLIDPDPPEVQEYLARDDERS